MYEIPTTEQMIGWLEEQESIKEINVCLIDNWEYIIANGTKNPLCNDGFNSRKEATLSAIDAALKYLENNKNHD